MPPSRARSGFTLLELLVVLLLIGVLGSLAAPSVRDTARRAALRSVLGELGADVYRTRALAARSGRDLLFRFQRAPDGCVRSYRVVDPAVNLALLGVDLVRTAPGVCLRVSGSPTIRINARGMPVGSARKVRAHLGGVGDSLSISMVGRVYRWGYSAWWPGLAAPEKSFRSSNDFQGRMPRVGTKSLQDNGYFAGT